METTKSINTLIPQAFATMVKENKAYRKSQKPNWARFKLSIKYTNNPDKYFTHYSYDWNKEFSTGSAVAVDNEMVGYKKLEVWILDCLQKGKLMEAKIYCTLHPKKSTSVMHYNTLVFNFNAGMSMNEFKHITELQFDVTGKVILHLLEQKGGRNV